MSNLANIVSRSFPWPVLVQLAAILVALGANEIVFRVSPLARHRRVRRLGVAIQRHCWWAARVTVVAAAAEVTLHGVQVPESARSRLEQLVGILLVASVAWLITCFSFALEDWSLVRFRADVRDNLKARRIHTQVRVVRRLTVVVVCVLTLAIVLTSFTSARVLGTGLLASAGIVGVVVGIASRPLITNFLAGMQILFSAPIRLDDVVVVEGEWGRVEEITFTYVVVRIWDDRRLVLPVSYFVDHPFENWTMSTATILATVHLPVDYRVSVGATREELRRILERSSLWDRRTWNLQVTDASHDHVELRALMSAPDAPTAWDLRCEVREQLILYLQRLYPESLPRTRVSVAHDGLDS